MSIRRAHASQEYSVSKAKVGFDLSIQSTRSDSRKFIDASKYNNSAANRDQGRLGSRAMESLSVGVGVADVRIANHEAKEAKDEVDDDRR